MALISVSQASEKLRGGDVVAIPTETVYGLAGAINSDAALKKIFAVKQRPSFDPLIVHVLDVAAARALSSEWPVIYDLLASKFWPGPLTLIAPKTSAVSPVITSGLETVAVRCPDHPVALELLREVGIPLAAPSANRFGRTSPTTAAHVEQEFSGLVPVVDGGACTVGVESTVLSARMENGIWKVDVLRPGGVSRAQLREVMTAGGVAFVLNRESSVASPGNLKAHYQPVSPVILLDNKKLSRELREVAETQLGRSLRDWVELILPATPHEAARVLYEELRRLSTTPDQPIWISRWPKFAGEDWEVIWDRVERASSLIL